MHMSGGASPCKLGVYAVCTYSTYTERFTLFLVLRVAWLFFFSRAVHLYLHSRSRAGTRRHAGESSPSESQRARRMRAG